MKWKQFFTPAKSMDAAEARSYMQNQPEGTYTLLDVRQPREFEQSRIPGSKLIPLPDLPGRISELDSDKPILTYCAIGGRSRAAAQYLSGQGFKEVYNLKGGIAGWQDAKASGPAEMGMGYLTGDESAKEVIAVAYGMEQGLAEFYASVARKTEHQEVENLLTKLVGIEEKHKEKLYNLYLSIDPAGGGRDTLENQALSGVMEGAFTTEEFLEQNRSLLGKTNHILSLAMMLETQAFDLYMRYSQKAKDQESRRVLLQIAEEEKAHVASLGRLVDAIG
jgi:rhodanese-related sulfurtransferase/rubrerythrin